ncbi:DnaD domain protein [Clostridium sp.]|uniref:DnaD domain protein n=1 Tax=Clostridium sp. TaxID=1506 RepID=UPI002618CAB0|nr:DnaD domain protein [Clostridium sp.]
MQVYKDSAKGIKSVGQEIFFSAFDKRSREIFNEDMDKFLVLAWIIYNTNYQIEYKGLERNQCYFSYSVLENKLRIKRSKLQRIIRELESEDIIQWIYKSNYKDKKSIIVLKKRYSKKYDNQYGKVIDITSVNKDTNIVNDIVKDTYSINPSINKSILKEEEETFNESSLDNNILIIYKEYISTYITNNDKAILVNLQKKYGIDILEKAIIEAGKNNAKTIKYIIRTLEDWSSRGFNNLLEIEIHLESWKEKNRKAKDNKEKKVDRLSQRNINNKSVIENSKVEYEKYYKLEQKLLGWDNE